jgi:replication factor A1
MKGLFVGRQGSNELRVRDSILRLATRYQLDPNELLDAFIEAWHYGSSTQPRYAIECRHCDDESGVFLITHERAISQFPIDSAILTRPDSFRHYFHDFQLEPVDVPSQTYLSIDDLRYQMRHVNVKAKVIEKPGKRQVRTRWGAPAFVSNVLITDDTGSIRLSLWNHQIDTVNVGDEIDIRGGHVAQYAGNPQLRIGKRGILSINHRSLKTYT